jgi:hypothetical protein
MSARRAEPAPLPHEDPCYRPTKAAEISGKHPETIRQLIRAGVLKGIPLGRRSVGVRASELRRWMAAMEAGDPAAFLPARKRAVRSGSSLLREQAGGEEAA